MVLSLAPDPCVRLQTETGIRHNTRLIKHRKLTAIERESIYRTLNEDNP